jgi:hypothetical protein
MCCVLRLQAGVLVCYNLSHSYISTNCDNNYNPDQQMLTNNQPIKLINSVFNRQIKMKNNIKLIILMYLVSITAYAYANCPANSAEAMAQAESALASIPVQQIDWQ